MIEFKSVGILRCAVILAVLGAIGGLIEGLIAASFSGAMPAAGAGAMPPVFRMMFGAGAIIFLPIIFAVGGFIEGAIGAFLYNLVARWTGGMQFTVVTTPAEQTV